MITCDRQKPLHCKMMKIDVEYHIKTYVIRAYYEQQGALCYFLDRVQDTRYVKRTARQSLMSVESYYNTEYLHQVIK